MKRASHDGTTGTNESWKQWEGHVVDGEFCLQKYIGGSGHSVVFLTERGKDQPEKAAIKLIATDPEDVNTQLSRWAWAARVFHPCLLRIFAAGRCRLGEVNFLYVVMEYAEEDLSQILPHRPLTPREVEEVLRSVLDLLTYLHTQGLVHGHLKPSNIMAIGDQVKLSTDTSSPAGEIGLLRGLRDADVYDPPEMNGGTVSAASDVWSLGVTLVEILSQKTPIWTRSESGSRQESVPILPASVPEPFLDLAVHCLVSDPHQRWTTAQAVACLGSASAAPVSATPPKITPPKAPSPKATPPQPTMPEPASARPMPTPKPHPALLQWYAFLVKWPYLIPLAVGGLALIIWGGARLLSSHPQAPATQVQAPKQEPAMQVPSIGEPSIPNRKTLGKKHSRKGETARPPVASAQSEPRSTRPNENAGAGTVVHRVLPDVSAAARNTIQGHVHVSVKVTVDSSGNVTNAALDSAGPSKYFARQSLEAAQGWKFAPASGTSRRQWLLRFTFGREGTDVVPAQFR